jgi:hypothetical protein
MSEQTRKTARPFLASLIVDIVIGGFFCCLGATLLSYSISTEGLQILLRLAASGFALLLLMVGGLRIFATRLASSQDSGTGDSNRVCSDESTGGS